MREARPRTDSRSLRAPLAGTVVWTSTLVIAWAGAGQLTLIDAMMLLAVLVVVPAAIPLHPTASTRTSTFALLAALPVAPALVIDRGLASALLTIPWLAISVVGLLASAAWWWRQDRRIRWAVWPVSAGYLVVGAAWLVADRLQLAPVGISAPFVQLTAVHFHYAGFASATLVSSAWRWSSTSRIAAGATILTVAAPPMVAIGFTYIGLLQIVGAVLLTAGLWLLAWFTLRHVVPAVDPVAGVLLSISSVAVLMPMALAVQWAVGTNFATPALSIPQMAQVHGVLNAVGFTLAGVIGWRVVPPMAAPG